MLPNLFYALLNNCDPILMSTNMIARSLLKLTSIHISMNAGIYYGVAETNYEIEPTKYESNFVRALLAYAFIPTGYSIYLTHNMLYNPDILGKPCIFYNTTHTCRSSSDPPEFHSCDRRTGGNGVGRLCV